MKEIFAALNINANYKTSRTDKLSSRYSVSELASASLGAVGVSISVLIEKLGLLNYKPMVQVDNRLASLWFGQSIKPINWNMPPLWDSIAGDYRCSDGWIKLHTNSPHHRQAALQVLSCKADRENVALAVRKWKSENLETSIVEAGGVAAEMRAYNDWNAHPQGKAVAAESLIIKKQTKKSTINDWPATLEQPLAGLRVLDLTRVLAGPVATRTLAGFGANVLRIDPPNWCEANIVPDITLGKKCCELDLRNDNHRIIFEKLLQETDVLVHGYRPKALDLLGYSEKNRTAIAPQLIEVSLNAYGWSGPWAKRRGFDSLVQMSCGIADAGMSWAKKNKPTPLPVQALDHATGYLMAAAVIRAITAAIEGNGLTNTQLSLARTATLLMEHPQSEPGNLSLQPQSTDFCSEVEQTPWGQALRLRAPIKIKGTHMNWLRPSCELGSSKAEF
jgi:hypothetical protein